MTPTLAEALTGTPYSVDETGEESAGVRDTVARRMAAFGERSAELARAYASEELRPLREVHRVRGVYESNALEGLGLDLVGTERASCAAPARQHAPTPDAGRCAPAARTGPPTRPCSAAGSSASTCLPL